MKRLIASASIAALLAIGANAQDAQPDSDWYPSKYGAEDRLGAVANLSEEKTAAAARLITTGKTYALGQITSRDTPAYAPRRYDVYVMQPSDGSGQPLGENKAVGNDDLVQTFVGIGSQIDGLGHMGIDHRYYNGVHVSDFVTPAGLTQMGTQDIPPIVTRGVLLDMTKVLGANPVPDGTAFNTPEIEAAMKLAGVQIEKGDVVIFHTGAMAAHGDSKELMATHPGLGVEGANYLADLGVVAVGADSTALEAIPFENAARPFEVHQTLLAKHGVYILENMVTNDLAADGVMEFFFSLGVPRLNGTVQAIINPVAIR